MSIFLKDWRQVAVLSSTWSLLLVGLVVWMPSNASPQELRVSEESFGCILDMPKVRNTRFKHAVSGRHDSPIGAV